MAEVLERLGVAGPIRSSPSLLLGSIDLSPFEVAQAYQALANEGFRAPLRAIHEVTGPEGRPLARYGLAVEPVADPAAVYVLRAALEAVLREGTGRGVRGRLPAALHAAGKTGTTNGGRDSWFAGFAGGYVAVVWVGFDDNRAAGLSGSGQALRVWAGLVSRLPAPAHRTRRTGGRRVALGRVRRGIVLHRSGLSRRGPAPVPGSRPPGVSSMLMRMLAAAGVAALLGGCAGAPPLVLPPVRDGSLPGAAAPATKPAPIPVNLPAGARPVRAAARERAGAFGDPPAPAPAPAGGRAARPSR